MRDILVTRRADQRAYDERSSALANAYLDAVLVHRDPRFARLEDTFTAQSRLARPGRLHGLRRRRRSAASAAPPREWWSRPAAGSWEGSLLRTAAAAQRTLWPATGVPMTLVAGPFCPADDRRALEAVVRRQEGLGLEHTVPDLGEELRRATASVSQCGYNTALDVVRARVPALVVPYATAEEDEQRRRARRLARLGALRVLQPERLAPAVLARAVESLHTFEPAVPRSISTAPSARPSCSERATAPSRLQARFA